MMNANGHNMLIQIALLTTWVTVHCCFSNIEATIIDVTVNFLSVQQMELTKFKIAFFTFPCCTL